MRFKIILSIAGLVIALDQFTKWLVLERLAMFEQVKITSFFSLVHVRNTGAAFGIFADPSSTWQFWLFLAATILATVVIFFISRQAREKDKILFTALGFILGGALGNLIDRVRFRNVVDFLDFHWYDIHWPAFNVADIAICIGAVMAGFLLLTQKDEEKQG